MFCLYLCIDCYSFLPPCYPEYHLYAFYKLRLCFISKGGGAVDITSPTVGFWSDISHHFWYLVIFSLFVTAVDLRKQKGDVKGGKLCWSHAVCQLFQTYYYLLLDYFKSWTCWEREPATSYIRAMHIKTVELLLANNSRP